MPRFRFNVYDGKADLDREGMELAGVVEARREAIRLFGALMERDPDHIAGEEYWRLEVLDEGGFVMVRIDLLVAEGPISRR